MIRADKCFKSLASAALAVVASGGLFFSTLSSADAAPMLRLTTSGGGFAQVGDGGAGDLDPTAGAMLFNPALAGWQANVAIGITKPIAGNSGRPVMDLGGVFASTTGGGGTLTIQFTDTDFSASLNSLNWLAGIGGSTAGSVSYQLYADESNTAFGQGELLAEFASITDPFFAESGQATTEFGAGNDFSVTLVVTIDHNANPFQITSFDAVARVPEPGTLALLGIGLAGLGLMRRRRSKVAA